MPPHSLAFRRGQNLQCIFPRLMTLADSRTSWKHALGDPNAIAEGGLISSGSGHLEKR